ncbi:MULTISPECIES: LytR/AlgR family response regulator transcription factor [unclassified Xanthobacter]|uniref:LytR/AlgR family response regulator transcription factor n=1 Tax=unclassified Xanthobacter TaxID=2623496 RepID=UPI001EE14439|nr:MULTISPECIES: LytTR family DNA-binding domain-containing protein [unclassified Xanthobacter]
MLRVMVVDDEPPARRSLKRLLAAHADVIVAGEAASLAEARAALAAIRPDVVFLDVELGDGKGFEALRALAPAPEVVFVTAYSRYAVEAFDVAATDFLMKPVEPERLALALQRLRLRRSPTADREDKLRLTLPGRQVLVPHARILALAAEGDFTRIHVSEDKDLLVCRLLGQFESELPDPPFRRLSRSVIVNLAQVRRVENADGGRVQVILGAETRPLALGRAAARRLREATSRPA